jgi:fructose-bisphosphate aldolase class 1
MDWKKILAVITYDETLHNTTLINHLLSKNIVVGIKTDLGAKPRIKYPTDYFV